MGRLARVTRFRGLAKRVADHERYVFVLLYKWNGIECIVKHKDIDGSISRKRSNIYLDEREGNNEDDADLGKEDKDTDIDRGMMAMRRAVTILVRV